MSSKLKMDGKQFFLLLLFNGYSATQPAIFGEKTSKSDRFERVKDESKADSHKNCVINEKRMCIFLELKIVSLLMCRHHHVSPLCVPMMLKHVMQ